MPRRWELGLGAGWGAPAEPRLPGSTGSIALLKMPRSGDGLAMLQS